jgi:nitroreductase
VVWRDRRHAYPGSTSCRLTEQDAVMQTWDALRARRNVRSFTQQPVAQSDLDQILEAGRRSPSAGNWQPWDFIVVTGTERLQRLSGVWRGAGHVAGAAAAIAIVAPQPEDQRRAALLQYDLGQATMAIAVAAADLGLGTGHAAVEDQDLARDILQFPSDRFLAYLLSVGYPADRPLRVIQNPDRRPFDEVVHREQW